MAEVWECVHHGLNRLVAVKFLKSALAREEAARQRFLGEARALAKIDSQYVVRVHDCGETREGVPYLAMERLVGCTLRELLDRQGPLPEAKALWLISDACRGVEAAHRAGLIHRDIKPGNLFLSTPEDGEASCKVLDFGIAKGIGEAPTKDGVLVGTVSYMAPEQARSEPSTPRTDVYAIGVVLFEAVTGLPFVAGSTEEAQLLRILKGERNDITLANVSLQVARIVKRATAFVASERFESVAALAGELENAAITISGRERPETGAVTVRYLPLNQTSRSRVFVMALGMLAASGLGVVGGYVGANRTVDAGLGTEDARVSRTEAHDEQTASNVPEVAITASGHVSTAQDNESRPETLEVERRVNIGLALAQPRPNAVAPVATRSRTKVTKPNDHEQNTNGSTFQAPAGSQTVEGFVVRNPYRRAPNATNSFP